MRKALVVGIDNYSQCPLRGCCNDADVARVQIQQQELAQN